MKLKLYQAVKRYGIERVRAIVKDGYHYNPDKHGSIYRLSKNTRHNIQNTWNDSTPKEQEILFWPPVHIALWYRAYYRLVSYAMTESDEPNGLKNLAISMGFECPCDLIVCEAMMGYMLESWEPENSIVKAQKQFRKNYYYKGTRR